MHQIPMEAVVTFGDASNDNELLQVSGWGVCMKNGLSDTKAVADEITEYTNEEDGFARYMTEVLFPRCQLPWEKEMAKEEEKADFPI